MANQLSYTTDEVDAILTANRSQYTVKTDPDTNLKFRSGVRGSQFVIDKELTQLGFEGVEDTDWENIFATA